MKILFMLALLSPCCVKAELKDYYQFYQRQTEQRQNNDFNAQLLRQQNMELLLQAQRLNQLNRQYQQQVQPVQQYNIYPPRWRY